MKKYLYLAFVLSLVVCAPPACDPDGSGLIQVSAAETASASQGGDDALKLAEGRAAALSATANWEHMQKLGIDRFEFESPYLTIKEIRDKLWVRIGAYCAEYNEEIVYFTDAESQGKTNSVCITIRSRKVQSKP